MLAAVVLSLLVVRGAFHIAWLNETALEILLLLGLVSVALTWPTERAPRTQGTKAAGRVAILTVAFVIPLLAAEGIARYVFRDVRSSADGRSYFAHRGPSISVNGLGFREREIGPKAPGTYRIVIVGDSFTWGQGIEVKERFSNLLEDYLGPRYEVLNFGIPGHNMPEHLDVLDQALRVSPDFVLLQLYINDFEMPEMVRPGAHPLLPWTSADLWMLEHSVLYDLATDTWSQMQERLGIIESYPHYMERNLKDPASAQSQRGFGMLRQFFQRAREAGVASGAVLFPNPGLFGANYPFAYIHDRVRQVCAGEQVTCLDLRGPFSSFKNPQDMWVSRFDQHPNARANERAAQEILASFGAIWRRAN